MMHHITVVLEPHKFSHVSCSCGAYKRFDRKMDAKLFGDKHARENPEHTMTGNPGYVNTAKPSRRNGSYLNYK